MAMEKIVSSKGIAGILLMVYVGGSSHYLQRFLHPRRFSRWISEPSTVRNFLKLTKNLRTLIIPEKSPSRLFFEWFFWKDFCFSTGL